MQEWIQDAGLLKKTLFFGVIDFPDSPESKKKQSAMIIESPHPN